MDGLWIGTWNLECLATVLTCNFKIVRHDSRSPLLGNVFNGFYGGKCAHLVMMNRGALPTVSGRYLSQGLITDESAEGVDEVASAGGQRHQSQVSQDRGAANELKCVTLADTLATIHRDAIKLVVHQQV